MLGQGMQEWRGMYAEVKEQLARVSSALPPCVLWVLNSSHMAW